MNAPNADETQEALKIMAYISSHRTNGNLADLLAKVVATVKDALHRRTVYTRTLRELQSLNDRELNDLGMSRASLRHIAHEAAYGL